MVGIALVLLFCPQCSWAADKICRDHLRYRIGTLQVGSKPVRVEIYEPKSRGRFPIILLVPGTAGVFTRGTDAAVPERENFGEQTIACNEFITVLVHYFDASGVLSTNDMDLIRAEFPLWLRTVSAAVDFAAKVERSDPKRIGIYGESLGGYLAVALAVSDPRIAAVSVYGTGLPPIRTILHRPPVLIQHGEADLVVPPSEARQLCTFLTRHKIACRLDLYQGLGHNLSENPEVLQSTVTFFLNALRNR